MTRQLTVHNAQLATAAVQINTLTISGKQVTLAVFRQLREEPLISDDGHLNGVPWGFVNYHPDKCADKPEHWHVVWQQGDELLRSLVYKKPSFNGYKIDNPNIIDTWTREYILGNANNPVCHRQNEGNGKYAASFKYDNFSDITVKFPVSIEAINLEKASSRIDRIGVGKFGFLHKSHIDNFVESYSRLESKLHVCALSLDELQTLVRTKIKNELERRQRQLEVRKPLADLPQLFIAV